MSYEPAQATTTITVGKKPTNLQILAIQGPIRAGVPFTVGGNLLADSTGVSGKTINIYVDGTLLGSCTTSMDGGFLKEVTIPTEGTYVLKIEFKGDAEYMGTSVESQPFEVLPAVIHTILTIEAPSSVFIDQRFSVTGVLARADTGAGIPNMSINLYYNGTILLQEQQTPMACMR